MVQWSSSLFNKTVFHYCGQSISFYLYSNKLNILNKPPPLFSLSVDLQSFAKTQQWHAVKWQNTRQGQQLHRDSSYEWCIIYILRFFSGYFFPPFPWIYVNQWLDTQKLWFRFGLWFTDRLDNHNSSKTNWGARTTKKDLETPMKHPSFNYHLTFLCNQ